LQIESSLRSAAAAKSTLADRGARLLTLAKEFFVAHHHDRREPAGQRDVEIERSSAANSSIADLGAKTPDASPGARI
jgi:hypothetical protein